MDVVAGFWSSVEYLYFGDSAAETPTKNMLMAEIDR